MNRVPPDWIDTVNWAELEFVLPIVTAILLLWFANMAVTGWLAARRGRDDGLWTLVAFFAGPIALLVVLLLPRRERAVLADVPAPRYVPGWPHERPPRTITPLQRLLGASSAAAVGAAGVAVAATLGAFQPVAPLMVIGAAASALVGYRFASSILDSDRNRVIGLGALAGVLAVSAAGLLLALSTGVSNFISGAAGIDSLVAVPFAIVGALLLPVIALLEAPVALLGAAAGGIAWAMVVARLLAARPSPVSPPASAAIP